MARFDPLLHSNCAQAFGEAIVRSARAGRVIWGGVGLVKCCGRHYNRRLQSLESPAVEHAARRRRRIQRNDAKKDNKAEVIRLKSNVDITLQPYKSLAIRAIRSPKQPYNVLIENLNALVVLWMLEVRRLCYHHPRAPPLPAKS
jgi:hypothetical protein